MTSFVSIGILSLITSMFSLMIEECFMMAAEKFHIPQFYVLVYFVDALDGLSSCNQFHHCDPIFYMNDFVLLCC
jgi:hypothetical protein